MDIKCIKCSAVTHMPAEFKVEEFACGNCSTLISFVKKPEGDIVKKFDYLPDKRIGLNVGQTGKLYGVEYTVTGMLIKRVAGNFHWKEYILSGSDGKKAFLSEVQGHWIFLKEIEDAFDLKQEDENFNYEGNVYRIYGKESTTLVYAEGCFDYRLPRDKQNMTEYIAPPYIISFEQDKDGRAAFFGEHISSRKVKSAFNISWMPEKWGTGVVQPVPVTTTNTVVIFAVTALVLIFSHIILYRNKVQHNLFEETVLIDNATQKEHVTKSFTLDGATGVLKVELNANVDNSWAYADIGLVNETTGEEQYLGKDIEYYHGYEDGENWSEGSENESVYLCGIAPGKYHMVITPQKDTADIYGKVLTVGVIWNPPGKRNVFIPIIFLLVMGIIFYRWARNKEIERWEDSDYSPF